MKARTFLWGALLALAAAMPLGAQGKSILLPAPGFDSAAHFDLTIKDISLAVESGKSLEKGYYVLSGSIGTIVVLSEEGEPFEAIVELVTGEWIGAEQVRKYSVYVRVAGSAFEEEFKKSNRKGIKTGATVVVVAAFAKVGPTLDGAAKVASFDAYKLRVVN